MNRQTGGAGPMADYVLTNGVVYTVDQRRTWAEAIAIRGKEIVFVGSSEGSDDAIAPVVMITQPQRIVAFRPIVRFLRCCSVRV